MLFLLAAAAALSACSASTFDSPYKMTFASANPVDAAKFVVKYLGAVEVQQPHEGGDGKCAMVKWVQFPNTSSSAGAFHKDYQLHFVKGYNYPNGTMNIDDFEARMAALHGDFSSYDQFMDFHVTLGTEDLDPVASKLHSDGVPLLVRRNGGNYSLFFEVPNGIVLELVAPKLTVLEPQPWDRCSGPRRPAVVHLPLLAAAGAAAAPAVWPVRVVYAAADPAAEAAFVETYLGGARIFDQAAIEAALGPGNGTCYEAHAVRYEGAATGIDYEFWWIRSPRSRVGNFTIQEYENYLWSLHHQHGEPTSLENYDAFMDFHVGLFFGDTDPIVQKLMDDNISFFLVDQYGEAVDLFLPGPSGQIYELLSNHLTLGPEKEIWYPCGKPGDKPGLPPVEVSV